MDQTPLSQGTLWSKSLKKLDLKRDKIYLIHQILAFGSLGEIIWLFKNFSQKEIVNVFIKSPQKIYTPSSLNFTKDILLNLKTKLDEKRYLKIPF